MQQHPYKDLAGKAFWRRSVAAVSPGEVDPVVKFNVRITPQTKVATAGSCFAQHIARYLQKAGFNYYLAEPGHPLLPQEIRIAHGYGLFSARYGNIYTARQLLQLLRRAYRRFLPEEDVWGESDGSFRDPFRPNVQPSGYVSEAEMRLDREQHLAAVRKMFESLDVFIFTLGLTECWMSRADGAVFPICPGVTAGKYDAKKHVFHNQDVSEVISDISEFVESLKSVNPNAQVVLTVSPVPLAATGEPDEHVLAATTYSKAVLRVAAEAVRRRYPYVNYFPSYEIITGAFNRSRYFAADLRNVTEAGVSHVMKLFLQHAAGTQTVQSPTFGAPAPQADAFLERSQKLVQVECDEVALDLADAGAVSNTCVNGIILTAIPKAGTHLALNIIQRVTGRKGKRFRKNTDFANVDHDQALYYGHARFDQIRGVDRDKWRIIAVLRDPRDIALSTLDYLPTTGKEGHRETYSLIAHLSRDEQLMAIIDGVGSCPPLVKRCKGWIEWSERGALIVRYEDLLAGTNLNAIADHLAVDRISLNDAASSVIGKSMDHERNTLNKGQAGRWKNEMSPQVLDHLYKVMSGLLERMGYS